MPNVKVSLIKGSKPVKDVSKEVWQSFLTDGDGAFKFMNIAPGEY